jgi:hypothetical protein
MLQKECGQCGSDAVPKGYASYAWSYPIPVQRPFYVASLRRSPAWIDPQSETQCAG